MKGHSARRIRFAAATVLFLVPWAAVQAQVPVGTAFTYQGRLTDGGVPATGTYDLQIIAYDAAAGGSQVGPIVTKDDVAVAGGLFTVQLDFGALFTGSKRWLEVSVRPGASTGGYTVLSPRQELTAAPNATYAGNAGNAATVAGLSCANGQVAKWNNGWTCGADANGGGTVLTVATGAGLTGGPITTSGTVAVAANGITTGLIADGAVTSLKIANGAVGASQINQAQVQARVSGTCPAGSTIQTVNSDGTVVCQIANALPGFTVSTIDSTGDVGPHTSIVIGNDGLGLIGYSDATNGDLKVAHCSNTACTSATVSTIDLVGSVGMRPSIAIGVDGLGLISYYDQGSGNLKVAHCANTVCDAANVVSTLDSVGIVGEFSSIAIGVDGLGLISYYDQSNNAFKTAHCATITCNSASLATIDSVAGEYSSLTIGADGLGLISYYNANQAVFKAAHCSNVACTAAGVSTLEGPPNFIFTGLYTSATIGSDGLGLISYYYSGGQSDLKVAHCADTVCATATITTLDSAGSVGLDTAVTIGADGLGVISYSDSTNGDLKVAHCSNVPCTTATLSTIDTAGDVGHYTSIAIGVDGLPLISYYDVTNGNLKVAHCSNATCTPFVRRR